MVNFEKHILSNGLRVLVHPDPTTPLAVVNLLYDVGARDENPERTGFAHLFEHLMFEGSENIQEFDTMLQDAGGENNAFTTNDITNYYISVPAQNLETALWLESDRMMGLTFSEEKLRIQKNVVIEEFRQSYLNQPYGDVWLLLRPLAFTTHPYRWSTIGKDITHIRDASMDEVKTFFHDHYHPANAILTVAGNVKPEAVFAMAEKWFGELPSRECVQRQLPEEPRQSAQRRLRVERDVPYHQIVLSFRSPGRFDPAFYTSDLLSDVLSNGPSSRLIQRLLKERKLFSEINAYISGSLDPGQFIVTGKLSEGVTIPVAEEAIWDELNLLVKEPVGARELQKVKNKVEAAQIFSESNVLAKAMNLSFYELLGDGNLINKQMERYFAVTPEMLQQHAKEVFVPERSSILHYCAKDAEVV
jgi:zinc protease